MAKSGARRPESKASKIRRKLEAVRGKSHERIDARWNRLKAAYGQGSVYNTASKMRFSKPLPNAMQRLTEEQKKEIIAYAQKTNNLKETANHFQKKASPSPQPMSASCLPRQISP